jgi:hypothetical protein
LFSQLQFRNVRFIRAFLFVVRLLHHEESTGSFLR